MAVLEARDLRLSFGSIDALDGLTLEAEAGAVTALLGPNGAGKTTFIRCCTALARPDSGELRLFGERRGSPDVLAKIALMPQSTGAWSGIKTGELLAYLSRLYANPQPLPELMALLGITEYSHTPYRRLSGGQQKAVNLAGALIGRPALVFLDEPTAGLDPRARRLTWELIATELGPRGGGGLSPHPTGDPIGAVRAAGAAVLLTTHDMAEAETLADRVYIVDHGRVRAEGTVAQLSEQGGLEEAFLRHTGGTP